MKYQTCICLKWDEHMVKIMRAMDAWEFKHQIEVPLFGYCPWCGAELIWKSK